MLLAAARYGYINAKVRGLRSRKLSEEEYHFLLTAQNLMAFLCYLKTTPYGSVLSAPEKIIQQLPSLELQLARPLMEDYGKIAHALRGHKEQEVIRALYSRFEASNLKLLLRARFAGLEREQVAHLLYPLGNLSKLSWDALWTARTFAEVGNQLRPSRFGETFQHALPQFEAQGKLFPLEIALDFSCFHSLLQAVSFLGGRYDQTATQKILSPYLDMLNILWIIRLKTEYGASPEETINYTLPAGDRLPLSRLNKLARAEDIVTFISVLPQPLQREVAGGRNWDTIHVRLETWFLKILAGSFTGSPFHIGISISYLLEKEIELASLITILQAKAQGMTLEETIKRIPEQFTEGAHVQIG